MEKINQESQINNDVEANFQPPENEVSKEVNIEVKNKSGANFLMFIVVAILFALLGGLGVWLYVNKNMNEEKTVIPSAYPDIKDGGGETFIPPAYPDIKGGGEISDETVNWKTYTNNIYGYSLKYPTDWIISSEQNDMKNAAYLSMVSFKRVDLSQEKMVLAPESNPENPYYSISIDISNKDSEFLNEGEDIIIDGIKGKRRIQGSAPCGPATTTHIGYRNKFFDISYVPCSSEINRNNFISEYNHILSTFKFTDGNKTVESSMCGGIAGIMCPEGYQCKMSGNYPDASGTCVKN